MRSLGAAAAWAGEVAWRRVLLLIAIASLLLLPGFYGHGPTDRDEARFVQASKQMMETGDYIEPRFQDGPRWQKPIGIYWAQTAAAQAFGGAEAPVWAYRIPSVIAAILAVMLTSWALRPLIGGRAAFLAGAMMAGLLILNVEARIAKTDAALLAAVIAAQGALARLWFGVRDDPAEAGWNKLYFWTALAVGVLLKGPIIFLPVGGTILWMVLRERSFAGISRLGLGWGFVWLALIAAPWFVAVGVKTEGAFFSAALGEDLAGKLASRREGASLPPGFHAVAFFGTFWPWTPLALMAIPYVWRWRRAPETAFLLGWIVPTWIVFELVATKLLHYTMPIYPAIAGLAAIAALDGTFKPKGPLFWTGAALWALPALALPIGLGVLAPAISENRFVWEAAAGAAAALIALLAAWRWLIAGLWLGFVRASLVGAGLLYFTAFQFALPSLDRIWLSGRMAEMAAPYQACQRAAGRDLPFAAIRYHEPSLVFLSRTDTALTSPEGAAEKLSAGEVGLVWAARRADDRRARPDEAERFESAAEANGAPLRRLADTTGFQYNGGRPLVLTLYGLAGDAALEGCEPQG